MRGEQDIEEALIQNLEDAGCGKKTISVFLKLYKNNEKDEIENLLLKCRKSLLDSLHKNQKQIDILDYLILDLRNNNYNIKK